MKKNIIWITIVAVFLIALFMFSGGSAIKPPFELDKIHPVDNIKGNASSSVLVIEYSDFQCPACRAYYTVMRQLMTEFGDRAAFVYRHFPLNTIHPNAEFAARAAEAAGKQGKFWEMHDLLFEKQDEWSGEADIRPIFESYAALINISVDQFKEDFVSNDIKNIVRASRTHAVKSGIQGTPTFFINGKKINNPSSVEEFRSILRAAIESR